MEDMTSKCTTSLATLHIKFACRFLHFSNLALNAYSKLKQKIFNRSFLYGHPIHIKLLGWIKKKPTRLISNTYFRHLSTVYYMKEYTYPPTHTNTHTQKVRSSVVEGQEDWSQLGSQQSQWMRVCQ